MLPETAQYFLEECRQSIDKRGELPSPVRKKIYEEIESYANKQSQNQTLGHYRRAKL